MKKAISFLLVVALVGCQTKEAAKPQPKASFVFQTTTNGIIGFKNTSLNAKTYLWSFGDGSTSTNESPVHKYARNGQFGVSLKATSDEGSDVTTNTITVNDIKADLIVYKSSDGGYNRNIDVSVDGAYIGTIDGRYYYQTSPSCLANYSATVSLTEGDHTVSAIEATGLSKTKWGPFKVTVTGGVCNVSGLRY